MTPNKDSLESLIRSHLYYKGLAQSAYQTKKHTFEEHHRQVVNNTQKKIELLQLAIQQISNNEPIWFNQKTKDPIKLELIESIQKL